MASLLPAVEPQEGLWAALHLLSRAEWQAVVSVRPEVKFRLLAVASILAAAESSDPEANSSKIKAEAETFHVRPAAEAWAIPRP